MPTIDWRAYRKTTQNDGKREDCVIRPYTFVAEGNDVSVTPTASAYWKILCPFCEETVQAFKWSLAGGGKRCHCGAYFTSTQYEDAYKLPPKPKKKKEEDE